MRHARLKKQLEATNAPLSTPSSHSSSTSQSSGIKKGKVRKQRSTKSKPQRKRESYVKQEILDDEHAASTSFDSKTSTNSAREMQTPDPEMGAALPFPIGCASDIESQTTVSPSVQCRLLFHTPATPVTTFSTPTTTHGRFSDFEKGGSASPSPNSSYNIGASMNDNNTYHSFDSHITSFGMDIMPLAMNSSLFGEVTDGHDANVFEDWQRQGFDQGLIPHEYVGQEAVDRRLDELLECEEVLESGAGDRVTVKHERQWTVKN